MRLSSLLELSPKESLVNFQARTWVRSRRAARPDPQPHVRHPRQPQRPALRRNRKVRRWLLLEPLGITKLWQLCSSNFGATWYNFEICRNLFLLLFSSNLHKTSSLWSLSWKWVFSWEVRRDIDKSWGSSWSYLVHRRNRSWKHAVVLEFQGIQISLVNFS